MWQWVAVASVVFLIGCAQQTKSTSVVCRGNEGCREQSRSETTYDAGATIPDEDPRVAGLEAAAQDQPAAAYDLALRFYRGDGVPQDSYRSLQWMRKAAEGGEMHAQTALGQLYFTGLQEMGPDLREADHWLSIAASRGDPEAAKLLPDVRKALADEQEYRRRLVEWRYATSYWWARGWAYRGYWDVTRQVYYLY